MIGIAFYQPDIAGNVGAGLRLAACLGLGVDVIEPCGFALDDRRLRRAAMDYGGLPDIIRHVSFARFCDAKQQRGSRIVLLSRYARKAYHKFEFNAGDTLLVGRETSGVPQSVADRVDDSVTILMNQANRSLNVITALSMVTGEALRQLSGFDQQHGTQEQR